jgi:cell division protein FtsB
VAERERDTTSRKRRRRRALVPRSKRRLRLVWAASVVLVSVYLYYQPLSSYFETRRELEGQRAQVESLRSVKTRLERRLAVSTTADSLRREARRIEYVRPGEQLFIVKGIPDWVQARRSVGGSG